MTPVLNVLNDRKKNTNFDGTNLLTPGQYIITIFNAQKKKKVKGKKKRRKSDF